MPDVDRDGTRPAQLSGGLLWGGVAAAPLAALVLLVSGGDGMLFALGVLLLLAAVAGIGLSVALRPDGDRVQARMEGMLLEEIETLREDLRHDISTAARATHRSFEERLQVIQRAVDSLRAEWEAARGALGGTGAVGPMAGQQPPVVVTASAAAPVVPAPAPNPPGEVYAGAAGQAAQRPAAGRAHVPTGVVRHTETVHHVTTRSTVVDQHGGPDHDAEVPYESGYPDRAAVAAVPTSGWGSPDGRAADEDEDSWTDRMLRERYGRAPARAERSSAEDGPGRGGRRRRGGRDDGEDPLPAGDPERWALRRTDERSDELRLGERRAAMRATGAGTEMRVEDRWASVRREWDRAPNGGRSAWDGDRGPREAGHGSWDGGRSSREAERGSWDGGRGFREAERGSWDGEDRASWDGGDRGSWDSDRRSWSRSEDRRRTRGPDRGAVARSDWDGEAGAELRDTGPPGWEQPALPAASAVPSWNEEWEEPVREARGRHGSDGGDTGYRRASSRRLDFEVSDERWR